MTAVFHEEWFGTESQEALADLARNAPDGLIVEFGSWEGRSTIALANACDREVQAVDTWIGSPGEISAEIALDRNIYDQWRSNVATSTRGNVAAHRMGWREYLAPGPGPIGLAFIDAEHTRTEVADNIRALLPLMSPGGIICGDDAHHGPVQQGVLDVLPASEITLAATLWIWRKPERDLRAMYRERCDTPSDIYLHLPKMLDLVVMLNAQHVIELGSRSGVSTVAWLYGLSHSGGRLTSVDLAPAPEIGTWPHWRHLQANDLDVVGTLEPADIVFIDTSHAYQQTIDELRAYRPLVRPGGVIVLHDTELSRPEDSPASDGVFPVKRAVYEFIAETGFAWVNYPECWGLAVVKVV